MLDLTPAFRMSDLTPTRAADAGINPNPIRNSHRHRRRHKS